MNPYVHVAVAVIVEEGQVLIAKRPAHLHQGGLWEFPGGKLDLGESVEQALVREIKEELDIVIKPLRPLIKIHHDYGDKKVLLDVWLVQHLEGKPLGCEGQLIEWLPVTQLKNRKFPEANRSIITALSLPENYLITPEPDRLSWLVFKEQFENTLKEGFKLVQFRAKKACLGEYIMRAEALNAIAQDYRALLMLNTSVDVFKEYADRLGVAGLHLSTEQLFACQSRPIGKNYLLGASCHCQDEIYQAQVIDVDFITLSPVKETGSHPNASPIGMDGFKKLASLINKPVYALGGLGNEDLPEVFSNGGQGLAGISHFWKSI